MRWRDRLVVFLFFALLVAPLAYMPLYSAEPFKVPAEVVIVIGAWVFALAVEAIRVYEGGWPGAVAWRSPAARWILALGAWCLVEAAFAQLPHASLAYAGTVIAYVVAGFAVTDWTEDASPKRLRWVLNGLGLLVGLEAFSCCLQLGHFDFVDLGRRVQPGGYFAGYMSVVGATASSGEPIGTFGNVNYSGEFFTLTIPVLAGWVLTVKRPALRWALLALLLVPLGVLFATRCRAAFGGLLLFAPIAAVLVWGWRSLDPRRWVETQAGKLATGVGGTVFLVAFGVAGRPMLNKLMAMKSFSGLDIESRTINWRAATAIWRDHPVVGSGLGSFKVQDIEKLRIAFPNGLPTSASSVRFYEAHNEPVQVLAELGVVGLSLIVLALMAWVEEVQANEALPATLRFGVLWGVGALIFASCFGFPFHIPVTALAFALVLAIGLARPKLPVAKAEAIAEPQPEAEEAPLDAPKPRKPVYPGRAAVVGVLILALGAADARGNALPLFQAYAEQYDAGQAADRGHYDQSDQLYQASLAHNRFKGTVLTQVLLMLWRAKRYQEILNVYDANIKEGPGMDAMTVRGDALLELGRNAEAEEAYQTVIHYYAPDHPNYQRAQSQLTRVHATGKR